MKTSLIASAALALLTSAAFAQTPAAAPQTPTQATVQRDVKQQQRIENGLQSGQLTTREAGLLERDEAKVDRLQARDLKDGKLSPAERRQLRAAQNKASRDISAAEHNGVNGNPLSASSQRMQADVQRNVNQEKRVENGLQTGALTKHEAGRLEQGQAKVDRVQAHAAANGHVGAAEQQRVQRAENRQSARIHRAKTNAATAG
jgi:hypothetical protein